MGKHFPTFWSMLFILYNREFEVLYEHDKVSIFGLVSYDTVNDQLCFENVYSMYQESKEGLISLLNFEWWSTTIYNIFAGAISLTCIGLLSFSVGYLIKRRLQQLEI